MMIVVVGQFILAFVLMVTLHLLLSLLALFPLVAIYFVGLRMRVRMFPMSWIVMARAAEVSTIVEENTTGIRVVKSFAAEREQVRLLTRAAQKLRWASIKQLDFQARFGPLLENLPRVGVVMVILCGGWLVIQGRIGIGTLIAFNAYILLMALPFMNLRAAHDVRAEGRVGIPRTRASTASCIREGFTSYSRARRTNRSALRRDRGARKDGVT